MDFACQQTALFHLLKSGASDDQDSYIQAVANSDHLTALREIILAWRFYDIERHCRLTASLLKKLGMFEEAVKLFTATAQLSPFPDQLAQRFWRQMTEHSDPLVICVARLELYLTQIRLGDHSEFTIDWPVEPQSFIAGLMEDGQIPLQPGEYQMKIARAYPGFVQITAAATSKTTSALHTGDD